LVIQGCTINHTNRTPAVTLSGISGPEPLVRCKFSDNIVLGGNIFCTDVNQLTIQNNTVVVNDLGGVQRIPIEVQRGGDSVIITGNLLVNDDSTTRAVISLSEVNKRQVTRALVANNMCFARSGVGIQCLSSDDIAIQNNMIVATGACNHGILVRSEASAVDNISVRDNDITVQDSGKWETGILIAADPQPIGQVSVTGNSIRRANQGVVFLQKNFTQTPVCALNRIGDDVTVPLNGIKTLPAASIVVGGATSRGSAGRTLAGFGDPNKTGVIGNIGDLFQRLDGPPGLYVNEKGAGTDPWIAK
jgi:putative cofactor-binding repeat protein